MTKSVIRICVALWLAGISLATAKPDLASLELQNGKSYDDVRFKGFSSRGLKIMHASGAATIARDQIPEEFRSSLDDEVETKRLHRAAKLYEQLCQFRNSPKFHKHGFSEGSAYRPWYENVHRLQKDEVAGEALIKKRVSAGDLMTLAMDWMRSEGKETNFTRFITKEFDKAFYVLPDKSADNNTPSE